MLGFAFPIHPLQKKEEEIRKDAAKAENICRHRNSELNGA